MESLVVDRVENPPPKPHVRLDVDPIVAFKNSKKARSRFGMSFAEREQASRKWTALREEEGSDGGWPAGIIKETSTFKERWDILMMLLILYSAVAVPFRICFRSEAEGAVFIVEASMSLFFLADLVISFHTAYLRDGEWVTSRKAIATRCAYALASSLLPLAPCC